MAQDLALSILIQANDQASKIISGLTASFGPVGIAIAGASIAAIGFGAESVKMAGNFQQGMSTLVTSAGESQANLKMVSDGVLQISQTTGTSTEQLAKGMYMIESSGQRGATALATLQAAAQGAKAENANLGTVTNAVTTVMTDYASSHLTASQSMNALIATVASGKTNLQSLASSMGSVLPLASSLGIAFPQVAGAIAVMTNSGMSAQRASMNLANAIRSLAAPSGIAQKSMASVGLSAQELKDTLSTKGLAAAIQLIEDRVGKTFPAGSVQAVTAFKNIMGGATGYNVALMVGGNRMKTYEANIASITKAMQTSGTAVMGWSETQGNFNVQMDRLKMALEAVQITIGTALLPALSRMAGSAATLISGFIAWESRTRTLETALRAIGTAMSTVVNVGAGIISFFQRNQVAAAALLIPLGALGGYFVFLGVSAIASFIAAAPVMIAGFLTGAAAAWTMAAGVIAATWPFLLIGAAIGAVVAIVILTVQRWGQITAELRGVWQSFATWFMGMWNSFARIPAVQTSMNFLKSVWTIIVADAKTAWNSVVSAVGPAWTQIQQSIKTAWTAIQPALANLGKSFQDIWKALQPLIAQIGGAFTAAWKALQPVLAQIGAVAGGVLLTALKVLGVVIVGSILVGISLLLGLLVGFAKALATFITGISTAISGVIQIFSGLVQIITGVVTLIVDLATGNFSKLGTDLGVIWQGIVTMFQGAWTMIQGLFQATIGVLISFVSGFVTTIIQFFTNLYNQLVGRSIIPDMLKAIVTAFTQFIASAVLLISTFITNLILFFTNLWNTLVTLFKTQIQLLITALQTAWTTISNNVQTAWNGIVNWLKGATNNIINAIKNPFQTAIDAVKSLWNGLSSTVSNVVNSIISNINKVTSTLSGAQSNASSSGGSSSRRGGRLSARASGGTNLPAGWTLIGEEGPEVMWVPGGSTILPNSSYQALNTPRSPGGIGGGNVTITVNAPQRSQNEATAIAKAVSKELAKQYRMQVGAISMGGSNI